MEGLQRTYQGLYVNAQKNLVSRKVAYVCILTTILSNTAFPKHDVGQE
jgi:hypothetical protein